MDLYLPEVNVRVPVELEAKDIVFDSLGVPTSTVVAKPLVVTLTKGVPDTVNEPDAIFEFQQLPPARTVILPVLKSSVLFPAVLVVNVPQYKIELPKFRVPLVNVTVLADNPAVVPVPTIRLS